MLHPNITVRSLHALEVKGNSKKILTDAENPKSYEMANLIFKKHEKEAEKFCLRFPALAPAAGVRGCTGGVAGRGPSGGCAAVFGGRSPDTDRRHATQPIQISYLKYHIKTNIHTINVLPSYFVGKVRIYLAVSTSFIIQPIYVLLLGTGLLSEQEGLGHSSHAGPVRIGNFTRTIELLRSRQGRTRGQNMEKKDMSSFCIPPGDPS
ncbi:hypothetical protein MSG28_004446 [Choristoneura fumiferana]|uniref:Uncharacterized protein n=1 Tax=Choristoneura fumiferana TaxID=7141 RepID=A0ACC0K6M9_CHOFU|nr:hypothetical protein MSG28_004446 [Choristoneura fumiferana]